MERPILKLVQDSRDAPRTKEWVETEGGWVCVWSMTMKESLIVTERAARPPIDRRGGMDQGESVLWQILVSCYDGDGPDAKPLFDWNNPAPVYNLSLQQVGLISNAIARVNAMDAEEANLLKDFTAARQAA